nr:hypothetical protein [Mycobacterium branderi]
MDLDAVRQSPIGELVPISGTDPWTMKTWEYWAYVPDPLQQLPVLTPRALALSAKAGAAVARLDELTCPPIAMKPETVAAIGSLPSTGSIGML